jgi:rhamnose utilization protein RhaD (predicted bifunctional aldolase and dehydrogenase)
MRIKLLLSAKGQRRCYELTLQLKTKAEEKAFERTKEYEKELKKKNRKAYQAYIASKEDVYNASFSL